MAEMDKADAGEKVEKTYVKREGTTAGEGHIYERLICMQISSRCAAKGYQFELKSNVEDNEKIFDDAVCKITEKCPSAPDKIRHLFLQAKHLTGKTPTIFKATRPRGKDPVKGSYPTPDISKWFESYIQLSSAHQGEDFEMVFFTTADIEQEWKCHFEETDSIFADILLVKDLIPSNGASNCAAGKIYQLKKKTLKTKLGKITSNDVLNGFVKKMKIYTCQPQQKELDKIIRKENALQSDLENHLVVNEAHRLLEAWQNCKGQVPVITENIFVKARTSAKTDLLKYEVSTVKSENDFTYNEKTVSEFQELIEKEKQNLLKVTNFDVYVDLIKQTIRQKQPNTIFLLFSFPDIKSGIKKVSQNLNNLEKSIIICIKIAQGDISKNAIDTRSNIQSIIERLSPLSNVSLFFLAKSSVLKLQPIIDMFTLCDFLSLSFSTLEKETKKQIINYEMLFFEHSVTLCELDVGNDLFLDEEMLGNIRSQSEISIGQAMKMKEPLCQTYIERSLNVFSEIKNSKQILKSMTLKEKYVIIDPRSKVGQDQQSEAHKAVARETSEPETGNVTFVNKEQALAQFFAQCTANPLHRVHLLRHDNGKLFWLRSGNTGRQDWDRLQSKIDEESPSAVTEDALIENYIESPLSSKVLLVSSNAGMGKSTLAMSLAGKLTQRSVKFWPLLVQLNKNIELLRELKYSMENLLSINLHDLLLKFVDEPQKDMFRKFPKKKVVVLLDGLDEISPFFDTLFLEIISRISTSDVAKVIVLTRKHVADEFLETTPALLLDLTELGKKDVENYFTRTFQNEHQIADKELESNSLKTFVRSLVDFTFSSERENWTSVTGVPLQTYMVAEAFKERCAKYLLTKSEEHLPSEKDSKVNLYQGIIKRKFDIYIKDKMDYHPNMEVQRVKKEYEDMVEKHANISLIVIFEESIVKNVFNIDQQEKNKILTEQNLLGFGIVTTISTEYIEFIHRSFAEYFCAVCIARILTAGVSSKKLKDFLNKEVLLDGKFQVIRKFLDNELSNNDNNFNIRLGPNLIDRIFNKKKYERVLWMYFKENCPYLLGQLVRNIPRLANVKS